MLLYLIDGDLAFLSRDEESQNDNVDDKNFNQAEFKRIKKLKNSLAPRELCESPEALTLLPFIEEVFSYGFDQTPDYFKLATILLENLINQDK